MPLNLVAKAAITVAMMALNYAVTASKTTNGPRLDDLKFTQGDYGASLHNIWATRKIEGNTIFFAEDLREVKRRRKTKGGKFNEYTYYGTWAVAVAAHEIAAVPRIWMDKHLVLDLTGVGPVTPFNEESGFNWQDHIRIYLGTETQEADPRMLATTEAAHGAGSCPAYRGTAYVMFEDVPLEKFGNRIPQSAYEVVSLTDDVYPFETFTTEINQPSRLNNFTFSPDFSRMMWASGSEFEMWDVAARTRIITGTFPVGINDGSKLGLFDNGTIFAVTSDNDRLHSFTPDGIGSNGVIYTFGGVSDQQQEVRVLKDGNGLEHWGTIPYSSFTNFFFDSAALNMNTLTGINWQVADYFVDGYGDVWACGRIVGTVTTGYFYRMVDTGARPGSSGFITVTGLASVGGAPDMGAVHYSDASVDQFVFHWDHDYLYAVDIDTGTVNASATMTSLDVYNTDKQFTNCPAGAKSIWLNNQEISLADLSVIRTVTMNNWLVQDTDGIIYDPINHALITAPQFDLEITWRYLDRISGEPVTLGSIASDVADMCGVPEYDFSALTQEVRGWSTTMGSGQDMLEPLFDAFDSDISPHDFSMRGVIRGGTPSISIDVERFARKGNEPRYSVKIMQAAELPRAMVLNFADSEKDQQVNSVRVSRPPDAVDGNGEQVIDMTTWAVSSDEARQYLGRLFRRLWNGREIITSSLTAQHLALEPADLRTLDLDGENVSVRAVKTTFQADGVLACEWVSDDPDLAFLDGSTGPAFDGYVPEPMLIPLLTKSFIFDVPLATDIHDSSVPFLYYAAAPYTAGFWSGADFAVSESGLLVDYVSGWAAVGSGDAVDWGYSTSALGDALPWIFDYGNTLNVKLQTGSLTGSTEDDILDSATLNLLLVGSSNGWEYLQFVDADLQGDGSYNLTGLLRGCRGTEQHIAGHAIGDTVLVVDAQIFRREVGAGEIADTDYYRGVTQGRGLESAFEQSVTFGAAAHKPYAPVHGLLTLAAGDWDIDATRRSRIGGANVDGGDVPLGEVSESWQADIMDGVDVVRTISGTSLPLTYTSADQTTDFGAPQVSLEVNLYQISPSLSLRGYELNIAA